jgi:DNA-binding NtrC family response regulator
MLREGKEKFDLVISGVLMPYTDGFRILKIASAEMDLPVISKASLFALLQSSNFVHGMAFPMV